MKTKLFLNGKVFTCSMATLILTSCVTDSTISKKEIEEFEKTESQNVGEKYVTAYDSSLNDFGKMLTAYNVPDTRVMNKPIGNKSGSKSLPGDLSRMLSTAMGKIGRKILFIEYDPSFLSREMAVGTNINRQLPDCLIVGDITEYDKGLLSKDKSAEAEAEGTYNGVELSGGGELSSEAKVSRLAMDMGMIDYKTLVTLECQVSNKMRITKGKSGYSIGLFRMASGATINSNFSQKQGKEAALRRLMELSTLQTLGKYFQVPYWKTMSAPEDKRMLEKLREQFEVSSDSIQGAYIKEYLFLHCVDGIDRMKRTFSSDELKIVDAQRKKYDVKSDVDLFIKLWLNVPIEKSRIRFLKMANKNNNEIESQALRQQQLQAAQQAQQQAEQQAAAEQQAVQQQAVQPQVAQPAQQPAKQQQTQTQVPQPPKKKIEKSKTTVTGFGAVSADDF